MLAHVSMLAQHLSAMVAVSPPASAAPAVVRTSQAKYLPLGLSSRMRGGEEEEEANIGDEEPAESMMQQASPAVSPPASAAPAVVRTVAHPSDLFVELDGCATLRKVEEWGCIVTCTSCACQMAAPFLHLCDSAIMSLPVVAPLVCLRAKDMIALLMPSGIAKAVDRKTESRAEQDRLLASVRGCVRDVGAFAFRVRILLGLEAGRRGWCGPPPCLPILQGLSLRLRRCAQQNWT